MANDHKHGLLFGNESVQAISNIGNDFYRYCKALDGSKTFEEAILLYEIYSLRKMFSSELRNTTIEDIMKDEDAFDERLLNELKIRYSDMKLFEEVELN